MVPHQISFDRPLRQVTLATGQPAPTNVAEAASGLTAHQEVGPALAGQSLEPNHDAVVAVLENIEAGVTAMQSRAAATREQLLQTTVALSRMVVGRLIGESADLQEQRLTKLVNDALKRSEDTIDLRLNRANLNAIEQQLASRQQLRNVKLIVDDAVPVGECRVSLDGYDLVSNLEQQLDEIDSMLKELIHEH